MDISAAMITMADIIDTDQMIANVTAESVYQNYNSEHDDNYIQFVALLINDENPDPDLILGDPYWEIRFIADNENLYCYTHAVEGDVTCYRQVTSVIEDYLSSSFKAYPNPANEFVRIELPERSRGTLIIYDSMGNALRKIDNITATGDGISIQTGTYAPGLYHAVFISTGKTYDMSFTIER
ncbi:MAG: T9SS type A sorting domain-containing protein [Candidatus Kapaibacterium sp.]